MVPLSLVDASSIEQLCRGFLSQASGVPSQVSIRIPWLNELYSACKHSQESQVRSAILKFLIVSDTGLKAIMALPDFEKSALLK